MKYIKTFESFNQEDITNENFLKSIADKAKGLAKGRFIIKLNGYKPSEAAVFYEQKTMAKQASLYQNWCDKLKKQDEKCDMTPEKAKLFYQALFDHMNPKVTVDQVKKNDYVAPTISGKTVQYNQAENSFSIEDGAGGWLIAKTF